MSIQDPEYAAAIHRHLKRIVVNLTFIAKYQILSRLNFLHVFAFYLN